MAAATKLPDSVVQQIQLLLSDEDRSRSCILSKSWFRSYGTLPVLKFIEYRFHGDREKFLWAVHDTLVRYRQQNLLIETLELLLEQQCVNNARLLHHWLDVAIDDCILANLTLEFSDKGDFELPLRFFTAKSLRRIRIVNCRLEPEPDLPLPTTVVSCFLVSLELKHVVVTQPVIDHLLLNSTSIEKLDIDLCYGFEHITIRVSDYKRRKEFNIATCCHTQLFGILPVPCYLMLANFKFDTCQNLTDLELISSTITGMFIAKQLLPNLPFLTSLVITLCHSLVWVEVKHDSLTSLSILSCSDLRDVKISCPKLKFLEYRGHMRLPYISCTKDTKLAELETTIELGCFEVFDTSWYVGLRGFLGNLTHCHRLKIVFDRYAKVNICSGWFGVLHWVPIVESVVVYVPQNFLMSTICEIKDVIHSICYPRNMTVNVYQRRGG